MSESIKLIYRVLNILEKSMDYSEINVDRLSPVALRANLNRCICQLKTDQLRNWGWGCGQILGPTMTGRKKNVVYGGREKESTSIV